jgi:hypothetical protein
MLPPLLSVKIHTYIYTYITSVIGRDRRTGSGRVIPGYPTTKYLKEQAVMVHKNLKFEIHTYIGP